MIFRILLSLVMTFCTFAAHGAARAKLEADIDVAGLVGLRYNSASTDLPGATATAQMSYMAGILAWVPLRGGLGARSGLVYNQRHVKLGPSNQGDIDIQFSYLDIPLTATYQFRNKTWAYLGPVLGFSQSKDVTCSKFSNCSANDVKSFILPWQMGIDFKFHPQMGVEFFYEFMSGDLATNVSDMKAFGANFLIFF